MKKLLLLLPLVLCGCYQSYVFTPAQLQAISKACVDNGGYITNAFSDNTGVSQFECHALATGRQPQ